MISKIFNFKVLALSLALGLYNSAAWAQAKVMNPGEGVGQLVFLTKDDVVNKTDKLKSLNPLSIPVLAELPYELSVVAGTVTLVEQGYNSHVQIKAAHRRTPNLDISKLENGIENAIFAGAKDGDWVRMVLNADGSILFEPSTQKAAEAFYKSRQTVPVQLRADLQAKKIFTTSELSWTDSDKVGAKAANYGELAKALNTPERMVVPEGFAVPFYYYQQFLDMNPEINKKIARLVRDPLMNILIDTRYREAKLQELREMITGTEDVDPTNVISQELVDDLIATFDQVKDENGLPKRMKLRSSTNSEDLPNFNGAGLYESASYKPEKDGKEKKRSKKEKSIKEVLRTVWASVWTLRAFEERAYFNIPHLDVKMAMQVNPSFRTEEVDGVVVTKNIAGEPSLQGRGVYIEAQRGDDYSVANPEPGTRVEKILVLINENSPLDKTAYSIHTLQKSNISDDLITILPQANPNPIMSEEEVKDLVYQSLKAEAHFRPLQGEGDPAFTLDLEFKVDNGKNSERQVFLKQARPYID